MSRQNYYKHRHQRQRRHVDEAFILSLVRRARAVQPRLGGRKLLHILNAEFELGGVSIGRDVDQTASKRLPDDRQQAFFHGIRQSS